MKPLDTLPRHVRVIEVGPRDGLQNVPVTVPTEQKLALILALAAAGLQEIEITSFVRGSTVPQLADADEVARALRLRKDFAASALVPNERGMRRAILAGLRTVAVFTAASDTFTHHNINMTVDESLRACIPVFSLAQSGGIRVRAYISTAFICPFEGRMAPQKVAEIAGKLVAMGAFEVSIGDTIGAATPHDVEEVLELVIARIGVEKVAVHFHDTRGTALANVLTALQMGILAVDSAAGGLGGCPFAPGAAGNLATEDLVYMLDGLGINTGIQLEQVCRATDFLARSTNVVPTSKMYQTWRSAQVSLLPTVST